MDFANILTEYESLSNNCKQSLETIFNINHFYISIHKYGESFVIHTRKAIEQFFNEQIKIDTKSSLSKNFLEFYRSYDDYIVKTGQILGKLNKDIIDPNNFFHQSLSNNYTICLEEFKEVVNNVIEAKKGLDKIRNKYYESCKIVQEQEKIVCKTFSGKIITSDEEINSAHDNLLKFKSQADNYAQLYKYEISKFNKMIDENEKKYSNVVEKFKINEEGRIYFLKCNMEKFSKIYEEFTICSFDFLNRLNTTLVKIQVDGDIKKFNDKFKSNRFNREEFITYENFKKTDETLTTLSNDSRINTSPLRSPRHDTIDDFELINEAYSEIFQQKLVENFLKQLLSPNEIEVESMGKVMEILYNNNYFAKILIDNVLKDRKNPFIKFSNIHNLKHFANILNTISLNLDNVMNENYDLNFAIIFIAERTFYLNDEGDKTYLCSILSKNKLYSTRSYWVDLIDLKLTRRVEELLNRMDNKFNTEGNDNIIINIGSKLKNIFGKEDENVKESIVFQLINKTNKIKILYEKIPNNKKYLVDRIVTNELSSILKEFIPHFANFTYDISEAIDMIVEFSTKYKISKEKISFFVTLLNSSYFTIKNNYSKIKNNKKQKKILDFKVNLLLFSSTYLENDDILNLLCLSKSINFKICKKIYKRLLLNDNISLKRRIAIWKAILNINNLKINFNYKELLKEINSNTPNNIEEIIHLDVQRTFFEDNVDNSRMAISSVLKSIAFINPKVNYCQGMNYVASFLYKLCDDEELTFYLMLGIFQNTEFAIIFLEELVKLKSFFYVFDRLIALYLPELHSYFKSNSIIVNYFCSPWFITLFTNSHHFEDDEPPKVILKIWDDFLLVGWKALMKAGLTLLKTYEQKLIQLKYEDLLHFLINDLIKSGFFHNNNYTTFVNMYKKIKLKDGLLNNLENEIMQDNKIKENDKIK